MFFSWKEDDVAKRGWEKNKWNFCPFWVFWFAQLLNQSRHQENKGNKQKYTAHIHSILLSCHKLPVYLKRPSGNNHLISQLILCIPYMTVQCVSLALICLCGSTDGRRILKRVLATEKMLPWLPIPLTLLLSLHGASCPGGHKCITATCFSPTYSVIL